MLVLCESTLKLSKSILILAFKQMAMSSINKEELLPRLVFQSTKSGKIAPHIREIRLKRSKTWLRITDHNRG